MSPSAIGHTGFTGTSLWIDWERDLYVVLLTQPGPPDAREQRHPRVAATHPRRRGRGRHRMRPIFSGRYGGGPRQNFVLAQCFSTNAGLCQGERRLA